VLNRAPILPGVIAPVLIHDKATIQKLRDLVRDAGETNKVYLGMFLPKASEKDIRFLSSPDDFANVNRTGTMVHIHSLNNFSQQLLLGDDDADNNDDDIATPASINVLLVAHRRITVEGAPNDSQVCKVTHLSNSYTAEVPEMLDALTAEIVSNLRELVAAAPLLRETTNSYLSGGNPIITAKRPDGTIDPLKLCDFVTSLLNPNPDDAQKVIECHDPTARCNLVLEMLSREINKNKLQAEIKSRIDEKMGETNRKFMLEQMSKEIDKELGRGGDKVFDSFTEKAAEIAALAEAGKIAQEVSDVIDAELNKLKSLEPSSSDYNITKNYLSHLTEFPWTKTTEEKHDVTFAKTVLNRDHYGLDDVKNAILQFVAVGKLNAATAAAASSSSTTTTGEDGEPASRSTLPGKIICLVGPPGVGKTSIGKSIAESLNRAFYRFSVGGLSDVSEIKGHRRTYVGAMPGKIVSGLATSKSMNPVVLIDEIDKLASVGRNGDPASALLEVLDPSQNGSFRDHYFDVPVDLSQVLFVCTANSLDTIPGPLRDRMEIIRLSGYDVPEKVVIAEKYLVPKSISENGLTDVTPPVSIDSDALHDLVRWYCREAGVRNLEQHINKISRKLALRVVAEREGLDLGEKERKKHDGWTVNPDNLYEYVGEQVFTTDRMYEEPPHGVVMGLAWTNMGGASLYIESQKVVASHSELGKGGGLKTTGQMGEVMKESVTIANTVARDMLNRYQSGNSFFDDFNIHMHIPEGATPKDGPSAGITMVTSLLSLALDRPTRSDLAMTGEVCLTGRVLKIGGVKEKTVAARRSGIACLVFPEANRRDFEELPDYLKEGLEVHFAEDYQKVFEIAFGEEDFFTGE
jgi:Lon-like ATP-dependent protease